MRGFVYRLKQFFGALPSRLNKILDAVGNAELNVKVKPAETEFLIESAQKVANRITTGLILAALIVGAALLMRVPTSFELFGYPGLAMICFLIAAGGGLWLVVIFSGRIIGVRSGANAENAKRLKRGKKKAASRRGGRVHSRETV